MENQNQNWTESGLTPLQEQAAILLASGETIKAGLFGIQDDAFKAIKDILTGDNPAIKLKAAIWLIERASETCIGETDPHSVLKEMVHPSGSFSFWNSNHEKEYLELLEKFHLQNDDESRVIAPSISDYYKDIEAGSNQ